MAVSVLHPCRVLVAVVAAAVVVLMASPTAATALSCASHPAASPRAIAAGTEELSVGGTFREHYDGAIFGTILSKQTEDDGERPDYGRTHLVVDVQGTFGPEVGSRTVIVEDDPGWLNGYAFEVGTHYFIPYVENEKGRYSHVCDPIAEVDPADAPELVELAEQNAWADRASNGTRPSDPAVGIPHDEPTVDDAGASAAPSESGRSGALSMLMLGLLAALLAGGLWARQKGRESKAASVG